MGQLSITTNGTPRVTMPIETLDEAAKIEAAFESYAARIGMERDWFAREMTLAVALLGADPDVEMHHCQLLGLLSFVLEIRGTNDKPGRLAEYLPAHDFKVALTVDHRTEKISWRVDGFNERPN